MKTLNEKITISVSVPSGTLTNQVYPYTVNSKYLDSEIFVGNLFYSNGSTISVDITDLARNYAFNGSYYIQPNISSWRAENTRLMDVYTVSINWGGSTTNGSETVVHVYDYPNKDKADINTNYYNVFFTPSTTAYSGMTNCTMQSLYFDSRSRYRYPTLIPRYPLYEDAYEQYRSNIPFYCSVEAGNNVIGLNFHYQDETSEYLDDDFDLQIDTRDGNTVIVYGNIYCFPYPQDWTPETDVTLFLASVNGGEYNKAVAIFEPKYKRYYLQWQDRFGNMQSQPFNCNIDYSEEFTRQEITTSDDKRKLTGVNVKSKWKLNSGWIDEDVFYHYESIYTSPFINLVDTKYDRVTSVLITGNYQEKNYRNQKKMINLNLDLEGVTNQQYIY